MSASAPYQYCYILVVDDDQDDHFFLRRALGEVIPRAIVESLYDGEEAMKYLNKCDILPDLIFLDLNMTKLSGRDTLARIRASETLRHVPVIILTTSRSADEKSEVMSLGASDFYSKPANAAGLLEIVREVSQHWLSPVYK